MKDEIKEILDKLLKYFKESNVNDFGYEQDKLISYEEAQILLDYITNLQEEKDDAIQCLKYYEETHFIKPAINNTKLTMELANAYMGDINNLQQENKKLQEKYERMKENAKILSNGYNDLEKRNEKAIEYSKELRLFDNESLEFEIGTKFINILQGEENDN